MIETQVRIKIVCQLPRAGAWSSSYRRRLMFKRWWVQIPALNTGWIFFYNNYLVVKLYCLFENTEKNEKEGGDSPFKKTLFVNMLTGHQWVLNLIAPIWPVVSSLKLPNREYWLCKDCMADILFDWFGISCFAYIEIINRFTCFVVTKQVKQAVISDTKWVRFSVRVYMAIWYKRVAPWQW